MPVFSGAAGVAGGLIQAEAAGDAANLVDDRFDFAQRSGQPFLNLGTDAATFLRGLFFGRGPDAALFAGDRTVNPEFASLRQELLQTDPIQETQVERRIGRETGLFDQTVPNPRFNQIQRQIANTPEFIAAPGEDGQRQQAFSDIVQRFDPTFQFRQSEGEKAINRALASRGLFNSGRTVKALNEFNSNLALGSSENFLNRLASFAGLGQVSASGIGNLGVQAGAIQGGFTQDAGAARASAANAAGNSLGQLSRLVAFGA